MTEIPLQEIGDLSSGIAKDIGKLGTQAGELLIIEINERLTKALHLAMGVLPLAIAAVVGLSLLGNALAYLITDRFGITLAGSFGLVGGIVLIGSALGARVLGRKARNLRLLPSETIEQIKEDLSWMIKTRRTH